MSNGFISMTFGCEQVAKFPPPGAAAPRSFCFSANGKSIMYLNASDGGTGALQLYQRDCVTGEVSVLVGTPKDGGVTEKSLTPEEELRRQRARMLTTGITNFQYNPVSERIILPLNGTVFLREDDGDLRKLVEGAVTPVMTQDGRNLLYVQDDEVYILEDFAQRDATPRQVTSGARGSGKTNGLAEYIAQEEFHRSEGFWPSPDASKLAYCEVDETHIPPYTIVHQGKETLTSETHRYAFAGCENAHVRLGVTALSTKEAAGSPVWMNLAYEAPEMAEVYIASVFWWVDGQLGAQLMNREQTRLDLVRFDPTTGERSVVLEERSPYWVNLFDGHLFMKELASGEFIWMSERDGYAHLYLISRDGQSAQQLTHGEWVVDEIISVDVAARVVFFTGNRGNATQKHFYSVPIDQGPHQPHQISQAPGTHEVRMSPDHLIYVDKHSSLTAPPSVSLCPTEVSGEPTSKEQQVFACQDARVQAYGLQPPELVQFKNRSGVVLHGALYQPDPAEFGPGPYPTVVYVYGGPGPQVVSNNWRMTSNLKLQLLRRKGFLVFSVDNQGSARRGMEFESKIHQCMGTVEVDDQVDGVHWLVEQKLADPKRVGITGWSYGGYMTLLCLMKAPETFQVGVSGAPVTMWELYDTAYTERYMNTPQNNPEGYKAASVLGVADQLVGKLLIIHGLLDENVLFRHTARLMNVLNRERKQYETLLFPDERHSPRLQADRTFLNQRLINFFEQNLQ